MLKLSCLKQYTKQLVSSPIKVIRRVISPSKLESSPAKDTFIKTCDDIFKTNPKTVINQLISQKTLAVGKDAAVFPLPEHPLQRMFQPLLPLLPLFLSFLLP